MSQPGLEVFDSTLQKTHLWLHELQEIAHLPDQHLAFQALRAVLHTLRDRLSVEVTAHLGAQLPVFIRGVYYEGWHPAGKPERVRSREEFLAEITESFVGPENTDPARLARSVFLLLNHHLSPGSAEKIRLVLPKEMLDLWPEPSPIYR